MNKTIIIMAFLTLSVTCLILLFFVIKLKNEKRGLKKEIDELNQTIHGFVIGSEID